MFAIATAVVVAAHALLLYSLAPAWIDPDDTPVAPPVLQVRSVAAPAPPLAAAEPTAAPTTPVLPPARREAPKRGDAKPKPPPEPASAPPVVTAVALVEAPPPTPPEPVAAVPPAEAPSPATEGTELPVYPTRLPAAGRWRYALERGIASGEADLIWQPTTPDGPYELKLEGRIAGITVLDWVSRGAIDVHGLAPERFVIRRRGRDNQAANFQRDAGKVTFSGPTHEVPLLPGVQDRLSWMLQLPAVLEAAPSRFPAGAKVTLMVVGARGGADVWTLVVIGPEPVGGVPALKLLREARKPRDTQVELWLDPARGHLPLRAVLSQPEGGPPLELRLETGGSTGP